MCRSVSSDTSFSKASHTRRLGDLEGPILGVRRFDSASFHRGVPHIGAHKRIAQLDERLSTKQKVAGSRPASFT